MTSTAAVPRTSLKSAMTHKSYVSVIIDGNMLQFEEKLTSASYHGGVRAGNDLRALIVDDLNASGTALGLDLDLFIQIYANGESLMPKKPDAAKPFTDFLRGFNASHPLSVYEDTSMGGPSGAGDTLLRQLKDKDCVKVVVTKPCGPSFQAMVKAQRQNGILPAKLTGSIVLPQAAKSTQPSYPFTAIASFACQDIPTQRTTSQDTTAQTSTAMMAQNTTAATAQNTSTEISGPPGGAFQPSTTAAAALNTKIARNSRGQRVDPRVETFAWLVADARKQNICYEHRLHGQCSWAPTPCPNTHTTSNLNINQLNALQVLARELPCDKGNDCQNWKCCFGHRCPFGQRCNRGKRCRFSPQMHITDLRVVSEG